MLPSSATAGSSAPRRALFVAPVDTYGGAERTIALMARTLASMPGWRVEIATVGAKSQTDFIAANCGSATMSYGVGRGGPGSEWRIAPRVAGREFDLVFSSHVRMNAALSAARRLGVLKTRRLVARESTVLSDRVEGARRLAYQAIYSLYGAQDMVLAQTGYMAQSLKSMVPARAFKSLKVLPNPVDCGRIREKAGSPLEPDLARKLSEAPHIAWCGRLVKVKNPLRAVATLGEARRRTGLDLRLAVVGDGPLAEEFEAAVRQAGLEGATTMVGEQPNPYPILAACRYGLLTSDVEGFPNVLLEMMACGVRGIVTTPCAGDLDHLTGVEIADGFSPEALARSLVSVVADPLDRRPAYETALQARSIEAFISGVLGRPDLDLQENRRWSGAERKVDGSSVERPA